MYLVPCLHACLVPSSALPSFVLTPSSREHARRAGFLRDRFLPTLENGLLQHTTSACGWYRDRRGRSRVVSETDCRLAVAPAPTSGAKPAVVSGVAPATTYARRKDCGTAATARKARGSFVGPKHGRPEAQRHVSGAGHGARVLLELALEARGMRCGCGRSRHSRHSVRVSGCCTCAHASCASGTRHGARVLHASLGTARRAARPGPRIASRNTMAHYVEI